MKSILNLFKVDKNDNGAALAMVLIFVVITSLWMASLAVLVQTSSASLAKNTVENLARAQLVNTVLPLILNDLTSPLRLGVDTRDNCDPLASPSNYSDSDLAGAGPFIAQDKSYPLGSDVVKVSWAPACKSGSVQPVASFVLTGANPTNYDAGAAPLVIGIDGGLKITENIHPPLAISGGMINVSGKYDGVNYENSVSISLVSRASGSNTTTVTTTSNHGLGGGDDVTITNLDPTVDGSYTVTAATVLTVKKFTIQTSASTSLSLTSSNIRPDARVKAGSSLQLVKALPNDPSPKISSPTSSCPTTGWSPLTASQISCICPDYLAHNFSASSQDCPQLAYSSLDPTSSSTDLSGYLDSIAASLEAVSALSFIPSNCNGAQNINPVTGGTPLWIIQVTPGYVSSAGLTALNNLTDAGCAGDGSAPGKPALQFLPGTYRFNFCAAQETKSLASCSLSLKGADVYGGNIIWDSATSTWTCDGSTAGVQFQLQNDSYIEQNAGNVKLCATGKKPVLAAPVDATVAPFIWTGHVQGQEYPIYNYSTGGAATGQQSLSINGSIFVPAGYLRIRSNNKSPVVVSKGVIARAVDINSNPSASSSGGVSPPGLFNGDRVVQLHFWKVRPGLSDQDLGLVQVVIRDYFGRRIGAGYKIIAWRTLW